MAGNTNKRALLMTTVFCSIGRVIAALAICIATTAAAADAQPRQKRAGEPFLTVWPVTGLAKQWWVAEYDHRAKWFVNGWRKQGIAFAEDGVTFKLSPTPAENLRSVAEMKADDGTLMKAGKTWKKFTTGQIQRSGWYGYGRYEIIMKPSATDGLISAFYVYTGPHFGDAHEEIDIEFLGKDTSKIHLNRFTDGMSLQEEAPFIDLGFDASEQPRLYAFEWHADRVVWEVEGKEIFRLTSEDGIPRPPAKIYIDLWAGGPGQSDWSGEAADDAIGDMLVQCVSYSPPETDRPKCSDLVAK